MAEAGRVIIPYRPRRQFLAYHASPLRWRAMVCHRRAGKTVATINEKIKSALSCQLPNPRTAYVAPFYKQAKDVAWSYAKEYGLAVPGAEANESELRIDFPNGGRFRLYGADNPDALRGIYLDDCALDEFADMRPRFLPEVIRPALSDRRGRLTVIGTPKGHNEFYSICEAAKLDPEWFYMMLKASETKLVDDDELASARKMMTEAQYAQEFECSFDAAIPGAYYAELITAAEKDNRIAGVPYDPAVTVTTAWDLGIGDDTAIWFAQIVGKEVHLIDYYENRGLGLDHYVKWLKDKPYAYAKHLLPHDAEARELSNGRARVDTLRSLGLHNVEVLPQSKVDDGINAARLLIPRCWFDKNKTAEGIEALRQYRSDYDDKRQVFRPTPLHDWTSHCADAFRYLAMGLKKVEKQKPIEYPKNSGIV